MSARVKFQVGDNVWSQERTYPWCPCLVSRDPSWRFIPELTQEVFRNGMSNFFFSNQPKRAWIHEKWEWKQKGHRQYEELLTEATKQASITLRNKRFRNPGHRLCPMGYRHCPEKELKMTGEERIEKYTLSILINILQRLYPKRKRMLPLKLKQTKNQSNRKNGDQDQCWVLSQNRPKAGEVISSLSSTEIQRHSQ